ncbi:MULTISPECIES: M24 family metallopeptidase [Burkholderiaceae]|uniref:Iron-sulfur cluster-binding protein n=1 Tax=Caballeronia sordidicola TaxID=196367 RepID=A0A242MNU0_CABSO|nr:MULTISPECIES: M24 family metallopeptidase [Burkholderiaceae]AME28093.1 (Fe-S)-binding protein [Burkholderia sp. PAMC 26561]OTP72861.1 iron-sulfur cluster-binding protein [Caballeronia sordidicola]
MSTTTELSKSSLETVGPNYDAEKMLLVREMTRDAIHQIARAVKPGMVEEDAVDMAKDILAEQGMLRGWHDVYVRFGSNTTKTFGADSEPGVVLGDDDIYLIDIGPTWKQWEGDGGDTFVTGSDEVKARCAADAREIFHEARHHWLATSASGKSLYDFAVRAAEQRGWELNMDLSGHRLADFPHAAIYEGPMADVQFTPSQQLWVLEIHIRNVEMTYGAFYEDMLLPDSYFK